MEHWIDEIPFWAQLFFPGVTLAILWKFAGSDSFRRFWGAMIFRKGRQIVIWLVCALSILGLLALSVFLVESLKSKAMEGAEVMADSSSDEPAWTLIEKNGVEYVSDKNVSEFYRFGALHEKGILRIFKHENMIMTWTVGMRAVSINGVSIDLEHAIDEIDGRAALSADDLANVIHPVISPSSIWSSEIFQTVVLDPRTESEGEQVKGDVSFRLANKVEKELLRRGFRVILARRSDIPVSNKERLSLASRQYGAVYLALLASTNGTLLKDEVRSTSLVCPPRELPRELRELEEADERDRQSTALAVALSAHSMSALNIDAAAVSRVDIGLITDSSPPSVMLESTSAEWTDEKIDLFTKAICDAITRFSSAPLQPGP